MWNKLKNKKWFEFLTLFIISSVFVIDPLINKGIFQAHDMPSNLTYFGGFYVSLMEGNLFPRWAGNIANLYGSPTIMFFYPMSYYLASIVRVMGFSLVDTVKILVFVTYTLSAIFFYSWIKNYSSKISSFIGAILYVASPYRITDIYARGSIAEHIAFMFLPMVLFFLVKLKNEFKYTYLLLFSLSISALLLSHPFMFIVFSPFLILYFVILNFNIRKKLIISLFFLLGISLSTFYTIPLLVENKYTHYDMSPFRGSEYKTQFLNIEKLIKPQWTFIDYYGSKEYQTYQIGLIHIFILMLVIFVIIDKKNQISQINKKLVVVSLACLVGGIFVTLPASNFIYRIFFLLQRIEYPWRFLGLILFSISVLVSILFSQVKNNYQRYLLILTIGFVYVFYLPHSKGHNYVEYQDPYFLYQIQINTDAMATLPIWAAQPDIYKRPLDRSEVVSGDAIITTLSRSSTKHVYEISASEKSRIADNTFYFPGWNVYVDKVPIGIQFQDPAYRGIITFELEQGKHLVEVVFENTKLRTLADAITFITAIAYVLIYKYVKKIH